MNMTVTGDDLQIEIGRLHVQIMAYEKERARLEALVAQLTPSGPKPDVPPPAVADPKPVARIL